MDGFNGLGCRVPVSGVAFTGFRGWALGFRVWGLGFRAEGLGKDVEVWGLESKREVKQERKAPYRFHFKALFDFCTLEVAETINPQTRALNPKIKS